MVDFTLSPSELATRRAAWSFASQHIKNAKSTYTAHASHSSRFQSLQPLYNTAFAAGLIKAQIPSHAGGGSESLVEAAILVEEFYAVDPSASLTIFGTGLGLTPLGLAYKSELKEFLDPFLATDLTEGTNAPIASLVFSEPTGVANWLEPNSAGLQTTAYHDPETDEWVINGEKVWATNSAGFDFKGADLACVVCRRVNKDTAATQHVSEKREDDAMIIIVTKADIEGNKGSFEVLNHQQMLGHTASSGPHIKYTNIRVPAKNILCPPGTAASVLSATFEISACLVGAMATGIQRAVFDLALSFSKSDSRGGTGPIITRQSVADLLIDIKMRTETSRYLTWKSAHCLHSGPGEWEQRRELALEAKVYCSDSAVKTCIDAINAVGVSSYDEKIGLGEMLNNAIALPIFDGGNVGIRRRALQGLFAAEGYEPWLTTFGKDGE